MLALGDSSYEFFCKTGKDFDEQFAKLGATRIAPRIDCDVDYDDDAKTMVLGCAREVFTTACGGSDNCSTK